ncbi:MAG: SAM-dependent methyltransferase [Sphingobacteriales bacterium]|nr:MAG: SAM-dependent methyltransferase [Sphingobacteriales bacterium]
MVNLNAEYWEKRYQENNTGWDIGSVSTPLKTYFDGLENKDLRILIPGCGNAYEAAYLFENGFKKVFLLDWANEPLKLFKRNFPSFPDEQLLFEDFFNHNAKYDLIIEQTFFCALNPVLRTSYVQKISDLLIKGGKLVGLLFNIPLNEDKPPFGGNIVEYKELFSPFFKIETMELCYNSIEPRMGNELFIKMLKC